MKVKIIHAFRFNSLEKKINSFLQKNESEIEIIEIQWKAFIEQYAMIVYKPI